MPVQEPVQAVVFDMDGVLLDSESVYEQSWRQAAAERGIQRIDAIYTQSLGRSRDDAVALLEDAYGHGFNGNAFYDRTDAISRDYLKENGIPRKPFACNILSYLQHRGYKLALASSSMRADVIQELTEAGLYHFFLASICGDEVLRSKPAPDIYIRAAAAIGVPPQACVAVEDSPSGIMSAYTAGMRCIMVPDRIPADNAIMPMLWQLCATLGEIKRFL